jgi:protein-tyrosine phosphatase
MSPVPASALPPPRDSARPYHVCFVCLGNICRSPIAEVVARAHLAKAGLEDAVVVDSAGTGDWHVGDGMDSGAEAALARRGYDGSAHRARQFDASWQPDLILAMDKSNFTTLKSFYRTPRGDLPAAAGASRVRLFGDVTGRAGVEVPDPYGGGPEDFDHVLDMIESAMPALVDQLTAVVAR